MFQFTRLISGSYFLDSKFLWYSWLQCMVFSSLSRFRYNEHVLDVLILTLSQVGAHISYGLNLLQIKPRKDFVNISALLFVGVDKDILISPERTFSLTKWHPISLCLVPILVVGVIAMSSQVAMP